MQFFNCTSKKINGPRTHSEIFHIKSNAKCTHAVYDSIQVFWRAMVEQDLLIGLIVVEWTASTKSTEWETQTATNDQQPIRNVEQLNSNALLTENIIFTTQIVNSYKLRQKS